MSRARPSRDRRVAGVSSLKTATNGRCLQIAGEERTTGRRKRRVLSLPVTGSVAGRKNGKTLLVERQPRSRAHVVVQQVNDEEAERRREELQHPGAPARAPMPSRSFPRQNFADRHVEQSSAGQAL